eukprot:TRINITY_DN98013_c0_g1_i1.p1 TRINITY_DN98013_c0_g1~~TRINITY_DN98013_c0_g1_i1.p1  ORF type:complete len:419 (-),score=48.18 TRINITY_DN98013_c0_g1_i1:76-1332(-)
MSLNLAVLCNLLLLLCISEVRAAKLSLNMQLESLMSSHAYSISKLERQRAKQGSNAYVEQTVTIPYNLAGLEQSLMSLATSLENGEASLNVYNEYIQESSRLAAEMLVQVDNQRKLTQESLDNSWNRFLGCAYKMPQPPNYLALKMVHDACLEREQVAYRHYKECKEVADVYNEQVKTNRLHCDIFEEDWPNSCAEPKGSRRSVEQIMDYWINYYQLKLARWNRTCSNATKPLEFKNCSEVKGKYLAQANTCRKHMRVLEQASCNGTVPHSTCDNYAKCWDRSYGDLSRQNASAISDERTYVAQGKAIRRVQCLVNALQADVSGSQSIADGVNVCKTANFDNDATVVAKAKIAYHPGNKTMPKFTYCNVSNAPLRAGTPQWYAENCKNAAIGGPACKESTCNATCCPNSTKSTTVSVF